MKKLALVSAAIAIASLCSQAQTNPSPEPAPNPAPKIIEFCQDSRPDVRAYCKDLNDLQAAVNGGATKAQARESLNNLDLTQAAATSQFITATSNVVVAKALASAVSSKAVASNAMQDAGQARLDRQASPSTDTSGTTSLVSKAGSSELLSLALDTGALTESVNGTTATLNTNADQVFRLITGNDPDCTVTCTGVGRFESYVLNPLNISASLDLAQQSTKTTATTGQASGTTSTSVSSAMIPTGAGKLSGITVRYQLLNKFDPRSTAFKTKWHNAVSTNNVDVAAVTLMGATNSVMKLVTADAKDFVLDRDKIIDTAKSDPTGAALANFFDNYFSEASQTVLKDSTIGPYISQVMQDRAAYRKVWFDALQAAAGNLFTFEYDYNRPLNQPITHNFKLIYAYDFANAGMLTFNGSASVYGTIPAGAKYGQLHYGQVSTEYDRTVTGTGKSFQTQLSLAGYWQYQPNPSVLNIPAGTVAPGTDIPLPNGTQEFVGTAGSLWVTQAKFTLKGGGNVQIPIAVSWSNKTDLLQGSKVGGQVGISYNFSSLAGLFGGGSNQ
jgi:hypothetical protein